MICHLFLLLPINLRPLLALFAEGVTNLRQQDDNDDDQSILIAMADGQ